jgi:hypothetical protein
VRKLRRPTGIFVLLLGNLGSHQLCGLPIVREFLEITASPAAIRNSFYRISSLCGCKAPALPAVPGFLPLTGSSFWRRTAVVENTGFISRPLTSGLQVRVRTPEPAFFAFQLRSKFFDMSRWSEAAAKTAHHGASFARGRLGSHHPIEKSLIARFSD